MSDPMRVMLVEDEALILMQLQDLVEDAGHIVVGTAMRSQEAIEMADALRPDLALVDLQLSEGDSGFEVAEGLKSLRNTLIVFVTANPLRLGQDLAGAAGVIAKPFTSTCITAGLAFLEECIRRPHPTRIVPAGMTVAARYRPIQA